MLQQIEESLNGLANKFPEYTADTDYEIAGMILSVGDRDADPAEFRRLLPLLIKDLRKDLVRPQLPVVLVGSGQGGWEKPDFPEILKMQQEVAGLPEFNGSVAFVETRDFWPAEDARETWMHATHEQWFHNAESFYRIGEQAGAALLGMLR